MISNSSVLLVFTFLIFSVVAHCQDVPVLGIPTDVIEPSPTAASLGTYGGVDLRKSTGGIHKKITILELYEGLIPYNPSIEYYSTGVKVDEWGGRLGISWSDNFTPTIQRTVRTIPDEYSNKRITVAIDEYFPIPSTIAKYYEIISTQVNANLAQGTVNTLDAEYDVFSFKPFRGLIQCH